MRAKMRAAAIWAKESTGTVAIARAEKPGISAAGRGKAARSGTRETAGSSPGWRPTKETPCARAARTQCGSSGRASRRARNSASSLVRRHARMAITVTLHTATTTRSAVVGASVNETANEAHVSR